MKILQTIGDFGSKSGGTTTCTYDLLTGMHQLNCNVDLLTPTPIHKDDVLTGHGEEWIKVQENDCKLLPYAYSKNLSTFLKNSNYDIYHTNGLWMHCNHETARIARKKGKPYIITTHGMLYPAALRRSYWKKWPLLQLFFNKDIMQANSIHVTCEQEMHYVRQFGYKGPIALIPNPVIILPDISVAVSKPERKTIGFLGRLHPIKHVENVLYGVANSPQKENFDIVIIGKGDDKYEQFLHSEVERLTLKNVHFLGFIKGKEKFEQLKNLYALFVPSDFENFGMIVPEALICGTPVMASLDTPWQYLNEYNCGWWVDKSPETITKVISEISDLQVSEIIEMGNRGRQMVIEKFSSDIVASQMIELYKWILNGGVKPEFVYE